MVLGSGLLATIVSGSSVPNDLRRFGGVIFPVKEQRHLIGSSNPFSLHSDPNTVGNRFVRGRAVGRRLTSIQRGFLWIDLPRPRRTDRQRMLKPRVQTL